MDKNTRNLMADAKFYESYGRFVDGKHENWSDSVFRVMDMHKKFYKKKMNKQLSKYIKIATEAYLEKEVLGAQRALQFGGDQLLKNHMKMYNCSASYCDRVAFFSELMHTMLCGAGVGFSVQWHHIARLPEIEKRTKQAKSFVVPDSIEGWAEAVDVLVKSFFAEDSEYRGRKIYFDLSKVRPKGALISGGFKAPGPEPLRKALDKVEQLFIKAIEDGREKLKPIEAYDICMHLADAVISGGVRRSAALCMFSKDDKEMMSAKTGDWYITNPQRGRSNNSVVLIRNEITKEEFLEIMKSVRDYGEPGFLFMDNKDFLFNPCFHKDTRIHTATGLRRIEDLYLSQEENQVVIDTRAGAGDDLKLENYGTAIKPATAVKLTQKNADIYEIVLSNGASVKATLNHEFPTTRGRFQLRDLKIGDTLLVQSEEGAWGSIGNYDLGLRIGMIMFDGEERLFSLFEDTMDYPQEYFIDLFKEKMDIALNSVNSNDSYESIKVSIPEIIWKGSKETIIGFLRGLFIGSKKINEPTDSNNKLYIKIENSSLSLLKETQIILQNFGISSQITSNSESLLIIQNNDLIKFLNAIDELELCEKYSKYDFKKEEYQFDITEINFFTKEDVYCLNQEETHTVLANAVVCGNCVEISMYGYAPDGTSGFQTCVRGDTQLITQDGIENIKNCVELKKEIKIWNSEEWKVVTPFQTGVADEFWRVNFSDGSYLDATRDHKFSINDEVMTTIELVDFIKKETAYLPQSNIQYNEGIYNEDAYEIGLKNIFTDSLFGLNKESFFRYIDGLFDSKDRNGDLSAFEDEKIFFGSELILKKLQLLFSKHQLSSVIKKSTKAESLIYGKHSKYNLIIEECEQFITSIEKLDIIEPSYCLHEKEKNMCVFNNVLTFQCNLTEINGGVSTSPEIFYKQCEAAAILGTLQAGYTDFKFLSKSTKAIVENESLIGVSVTGWMNNPQILFDDEVMKKGAEIVKRTNKKMARLLGIKQAARTTTVKPSGNASVLLGTSSGIHGEHSPLYFRHVQFNKETDVAKLFKEQNPDMVEESVWSSGKTDYCVAFPVISPPNSIYKSDLLGIKQLEYVKKAQNNWIENGTNVELCVHPEMRHNVSNTITIDNWDDVTEYVYENRYSFCGISFLAASGDKAYAQAPFTEVLTLNQIIAKYGDEALFTSALIEAGLGAFDNDLWGACSTALGYGEDISAVNHHNVLKRDFVRRFEKFSEHFVSKEECSNCLKDVYNFHKWWRIQNSLKDMNFTIKNEAKEKDIDTMGAQACSGGACEVW